MGIMDPVPPETISFEDDADATGEFSWKPPAAAAVEKAAFAVGVCDDASSDRAVPSGC